MISRDLFDMLDEASVKICVRIRPMGLNEMYTSGRGGNIRKKAKGIAYYNELTTLISQELMKADFSPATGLYHFLVVCGYPDFLNADFVTEAKRAIKHKRPMRTEVEKKNKKGERVVAPAFTSLIKRRDSDGPLKPIQDAFFECLGMDDSCVVTSISGKAYSPEHVIHIALIPLLLEDALDLSKADREVYAKWTEER